MDEAELFAIIEMYEETHPLWRSDFVDSARSWYEKTGHISSRQMEVLESIIEKNNMVAKDGSWYYARHLPWQEKENR